MATQYTVDELQGIPSSDAINNNLNKIGDELDEKLDRRALSGNTMKDALDMNSFRIVHVKEAAQGTEAAPLNQIRELIGAEGVDLVALYGLFGSDDSYVIGETSFQTTINASSVDVEEGVFWAPQESEAKLRHILNTVNVSFADKADGSYAIVIDEDNELSVVDGSPSNGIELFYVEILNDSVDSVTQPHSTLLVPLDLVNSLDSQAYGTVYDTLDNRLEASEQEIVDSRDSDVYGSHNSLDNRLESGEDEIETARNSDVTGSHSALDDRLEAAESRYEAVKDKTDYITISENINLDDIGSRVDELDASVILQGEWDASAGSFPGSGNAQRGHSYVVSTGGTVDGIEFVANDRIVALTDDASTSTYVDNWLKLDYTDQVLSVAGKTGAVTLSVSDLTDSNTVLRNSDLEDNGGTIPEIDHPAGYTGQQYFEQFSLTDAASISWNLNEAQVAEVTLGGDRTLSNPSNQQAGGTYILIVKQDGTGGRSLSYGSNYIFPEGQTPVLTQTANAIDILTFISDGSNMLVIPQYDFR